MNVLKQVQEFIEQKRNIFITGGGGVGKSYLLKQLKKIYPDLVITSTTGISAINVEGQTLHSWAGIGLCQKNEKTQAQIICKNEEKLKYLNETKLLAIDEISMLDAYTFKYVDDFLSIVRKNPHPFGGIQVILIGDFFQLPPVGIEQGNKYCFESPLWKKLNLQIIELKDVHRQTDKILIEALNNIRTGNITQEQIELFKCRNDVPPPKEAIRLYPTRNETDAYNYQCYKEIVGEEKTYFAKDLFHNKDKILNPDFDKLSKAQENAYTTFNDNCNLPEFLKLKVGTRVMLLSNIDLEKGLVNGSCGVVKNLDNKTVDVKFDNGITKTIKKTKASSYKDGKVQFTRTQLPLKLAYACTIHKSQGKTFDKIYVNLGSTFTPGQAYVALSRITSLNGLYLKNFNENKIKANEKVIQFYKEMRQI